MIENNQIYSEPANVGEWDDRRQIMAKLLRYPDLKETYPEANTFYNTYVSTSPGLFAQWDEALFQAVIIPENYANELNATTTQVADLITQLAEYDAALPSLEAVRNADSLFFAGRLVILRSILSLMQEEEEALNAVDALRAPAFDQCLGNLNILPQETIYEANQIFLNGIALKKARGEDWSDEDMLVLEQIAQQCPEIAGSTRGQAANWLPVGHPDRNDPEEWEIVDCEGGERKPEMSGTETTRLLNLSPNPASETLTLTFVDEFSGSVSISPLNGKDSYWVKDLLDQKQIAIPVGAFEAGTYVLKAVSNRGHREVQLFVITN